jgi:N,N'-diacetylchitobiose transport system permease protein
MSDTMSAGAESLPARSIGRRDAPPRPRTATSVMRRALPYLAILPTVVTFLVLLGYPVLLVILLSFQKYNLAELFNHRTTWIGLDNYREILGNAQFVTIVIRTFLFTVANVALTIGLGTLVALLLERLGRWMRLLVSAAMVLAWAVPAVTGSVIFQWLFDSKFGVVNWALTTLGIFGDFTNHSWFETGLSTFAIITMLMVWQAVPFVAFSVFAGIGSIPREEFEAARVDGAGERAIFRWITLPSLAPLFMILTFLSCIWDFKVFTQIWTMRQGGPNGETVTLAIYAYQTGISGSRFGVAAAVSCVMVALLLVVLVPYIRRMIRTEEPA